MAELELFIAWFLAISFAVAMAFVLIVAAVLVVSGIYGELKKKKEDTDG